MSKKIFFLILTGSLLFFLTACEKEKAKEIVSEKEGVEYYQRGEYKKALPLLQQAADSGNAAAHYYLGLIHLKNNHKEESGKNACNCFVKSADSGYQKAYLKSAGCYLTGTGVEQDFKSAFEWGKKAADTADEIRMDDRDRLFLALLMGGLYANGKGTLQDFSEAAKWYEKAAETGDATGQSMMAFFTYSGKGVLMNREKSRYWAEKAAAQGSPYGEVILGMLSQYRENPDIKEAINWYEKAARQDNKVAYYQLGVIYEKGLAVKKDLAKAHHYYQLAAESGRDYIIQELVDFETRNNLNKKD